MQRGMTVTDVARSRLSIDYRNSMASAVGAEHGLTDDMLDDVAPEIATEHERIAAEHAAGEQRWMDLPDNTLLAAEINAFAAGARQEFSDFILIGIGGSSLGAIATVQALTSLLEPLMIVILGGIIGTIVTAMYLPMYAILQKID